jgi:hypothetical protein
MAIAIIFIIAITAMIAYATHYECEHFEENHKKKKRTKSKAKKAAN